MADTDLLIERDGPTLLLTMNRPERRNALSIDMIVAMADTWDRVHADDTVRSVILTGAEGAYCSGGDLNSGWMAGGGSKGGTTIGKTDELGYFPVEDSVHVNDFHATLLHLLGLNHEKLTYKFQGRNFRLTDVAGQVVTKVLA